MKPAVALALSLTAAACGPPPPPAPVLASNLQPSIDHETCFVLQEVKSGINVNRSGGDRCERRHVPASTFKVPHALIALETGARRGPDDPERWDGKKRDLDAWNRDHTLKSAMQWSVLWYFQRTAERIGRDRMTEQLSRLRYGNGLVGDKLTTFWIQGPLAISADEQVDFMARLARRALPLRPEVMDAVDAMILQEPGTIRRAEPIVVDVTWDPTDTQLFAKTGSMDDGTTNVRWLVGHVKHKGRSFAFASLVVANEELSIEAVSQAMRELREAGIVRDK